MYSLAKRCGGAPKSKAQAFPVLGHVRWPCGLVRGAHDDNWGGHFQHLAPRQLLRHGLQQDAPS